MIRIVESTLVSSTGSMAKLPAETLPEVAFAGRSNVGKSSLLNTLSGRKNLFKVSKSPGRTRTIVHVKARLESGAEIYLVDLPGFGYARVSKGMSSAWAKIIEGYLAKRHTLHLVVLLVDVRRGIQDEEDDLIAYLQEIGIPILLVATKLDRVPKSKQKAALEKLKKETNAALTGTSSATGFGVDQLLHRIAKACGYAT